MSADEGRAGRSFLFTSEAVSEGHPDKLCDQVSDAILDACLQGDPHSKVACEATIKGNTVMVLGEITTQARVDFAAVAREVLHGTGAGAAGGGLEVAARVGAQSPELAGVQHGRSGLEAAAGDSCTVFGYASDETRGLQPLTHAAAAAAARALADAAGGRGGGGGGVGLWWLRPGARVQVTARHRQRADGSIEPQELHTVAVSVRHAAPLSQAPAPEAGACNGLPGRAPSAEEMRRIIVEDVVKPALSDVILGDGRSALALLGDDTRFHVNLLGDFAAGEAFGEAGLTGHRIVADTYGGWGAHGGGAFSGKDPSKVDRSGGYACRQMAKSAVASGLCRRALVQLSYAIGEARPLALYVETYGSERGALAADDVARVLKAEFDCRPGAIAEGLALREPKYRRTAARGHFGQTPVEEGGLRHFEWERPRDLSKYAAMTPEQVAAELERSGHLERWAE